MACALKFCPPLGNLPHSVVAFPPGFQQQQTGQGVSASPPLPWKASLLPVTGWRPGIQAIAIVRLLGVFLIYKRNQCIEFVNRL
jgi:hypothetical protein